MSVILISAQVKKEYTEAINVAQINDALITYDGDTDITDGLEALKAAILAAIPDAADCVQCSHTGKVDAGANICPLCNGMTKTAGQYKIKSLIEGFETV